MVSDASKDVQTPLRPKNFANMIAQRIMAMMPRIREPAMAILGSSTAEKYAARTMLIPAKLDKLKRSQVQKNIKAIKEGLKLSKDGIIIPFSAETKQGRDEIWALIDELTGLAATEEA